MYSSLVYSRLMLHEIVDPGLLERIKADAQAGLVIVLASPFPDQLHRLFHAIIFAKRCQPIRHFCPWKPKPYFLMFSGAMPLAMSAVS